MGRLHSCKASHILTSNGVTVRGEFVCTTCLDKNGASKPGQYWSNWYWHHCCHSNPRRLQAGSRPFPNLLNSGAVVGVIFPPVSSPYIIHVAVICLRLLMQTIPRPFSLARARAGNNKATNRYDHNHHQQFKFEMTRIRDKPRLSG